MSAINRRYAPMVQMICIVIIALCYVDFVMLHRYEVLLKLLAGMAVAVIPSSLSYCQATSVAVAQAEQTAREADAGYKLLVQSVHHLEQVVKMQDAALLMLLADRGARIVEERGRVVVEPNLPYPHAGPDAGVPPQPAPPQEVYRSDVTERFQDLPESNAEALRQQARPKQ